MFYFMGIKEIVFFLLLDKQNTIYSIYTYTIG